VAVLVGVQQGTTYGLGLIAYAHNDVDLKAKIFAALETLIVDERASQRDMRIAAIHGVRLLKVNPSDSEKAQKLLFKRCLATLQEQRRTLWP
jgi:hypothetical protein